jgi:hypothetical protein
LVAFGLATLLLVAVAVMAAAQLRFNTTMLVLLQDLLILLLTARLLPLHQLLIKGQQAVQ